MLFNLLLKWSFVNNIKLSRRKQTPRAPNTQIPPLSDIKRSAQRHSSPLLGYNKPPNLINIINSIDRELLTLLNQLPKPTGQYLVVMLRLKVLMEPFFYLSHLVKLPDLNLLLVHVL